MSQSATVFVCGFQCYIKCGFRLASNYVNIGSTFEKQTNKFRLSNPSGF